MAEDDQYQAVMGNVVKMRTMADGTIRLEVDLHTPDDQAYTLAVTRVARVGAPVAVARLSDDAATQQRAQGVVAEAECEPAPDKQTPPPEHKGPYGKENGALFRQGTFLAPPVLRKIASDADYQEWCRNHSKGCAICGYVDYDQDTGVVQCEYAHVRRADNSGTSIKPEYSGLPLCREHHRMQHDNGEAAALNSERDAVSPMTPEGAKEWFDKKAAAYLSEWAKSRFVEKFNTVSLTEINPAHIAAWFHEHDLYAFLPRELREHLGEH